MNYTLLLAKRYFFSKHKKSFINILSVLSMIGVAVGTAALVIVLSAFNGMEGVIRDLFVSFDPELKIVPKEGKSFLVNEELKTKLKKTEGVELVSEVIEDNALLRYKSVQMIVRMRGVSENYTLQRDMKSHLVKGKFDLGDEMLSGCVLGRTMADIIKLEPENLLEQVQLWYPKKTSGSSLNPESAFRKMALQPKGVFTADAETDEKVIYVPLAYAESLCDYEGKRSYFEVNCKQDFNIEVVKENLQAQLGERFQVLNQDEQHATLLKVLRIEKLFVFLALSLIVLIASFNIYVSLGMLAIDKKKEMAWLYALGAQPQQLATIYLWIGIIIATIGALSGLFLGYGVCLLQQTYGFVKMGLESSIVENYPVKMLWADFALIASFLVGITLLASYFPAQKVASWQMKGREIQD